MPRDAQGQYSLPSIYLAVTGQTVLAEQHNVPLQDIAQALTNSLPRNGSAPMGANLPMANYRITQLGAAQQPGDAVNLGQAAAIGVPVGTVLDFAGSVAPTGYLMCFGQSVLRADYPALFDAIGTAYGSESGSTFNLPDCRGRTTAGRNNMGGTSSGRLTGTTMSPNGNTLGATGGAQTHTLTNSEMPAHSHTGSTSTNGAHNHSLRTGWGGSTDITRVSRNDSQGNLVNASGVIDSAGAHSHTLNINNTGSGQAHNNVQPTIVMNKIIKAFQA